MRETAYVDALNDIGDYLPSWATTERGQVLDFVVQYETTVAGRRLPVVRYDCRHGFPHRDRLDRRGREIVKDPMPRELSRKAALQVARQEIIDNWERYKDDFFRSEP